MIFVTVGTHEQQFNRLVKEVDELKKDSIITEKVFIQTGYSDYIPEYCEFKQILEYDEMRNKMLEARLIITHGGPASFMEAISMGKTPVVVPRQLQYKEHINNHQIEFCKSVLSEGYNLFLVDRISDLKLFLNIETNAISTKSNNKEFVASLKKIISEDV